MQPINRARLSSSLSEMSDIVTTNILLDHPDIDINALGNSNGITALLMAVQRKNKDIAKRLLAIGADPNRIGNESTCLREAVWREDMEMAELLLSHDANINANLPGNDNVH